MVCGAWLLTLSGYGHHNTKLFHDGDEILSTEFGIG